MQELLDEITKMFDEFKENADKRIAGNKAAGVRSRKASKVLEGLFFEWRRASIQADKE